MKTNICLVSLRADYRHLLSVIAIVPRLFHPKSVHLKMASHQNLSSKRLLVVQIIMLT